MPQAITTVGQKSSCLEFSMPCLTSDINILPEQSKNEDTNEKSQIMMIHTPIFLSCLMNMIVT